MQFQFDATQVTPDAGRQLPIPVGVYRAMLVKSEIKPTANGAGIYIAAEFKVIDGKYNGRSVYTNFNVQHQSEKAQEKGKGQFSALCHAVGILTIQDTSQLHNRPLNITVRIETGTPRADGNGNYDDRNEISAFTACDNAPAIQPGFAPPPAFQQPAPISHSIPQPRESMPYPPTQDIQSMQQPSPQGSQSPYMGQPAPQAWAQPTPQEWAQPAAQPWGQPWEQPEPQQMELPMEFQQAPAAAQAQPAWAGANPVQQAAPAAQQQPVGAGAPPPWAQAVK